MSTLSTASRTQGSAPRGLLSFAAVQLLEASPLAHRQEGLVIVAVGTVPRNPHELSPSAGQGPERALYSGPCGRLS